MASLPSRISEGQKILVLFHGNHTSQYFRVNLVLNDNEVKWNDEVVPNGFYKWQYVD